MPGHSPAVNASHARDPKGTPPDATQPLRGESFNDAQKLVVKDFPANAAGEFTRVSIVRSSLKYPLLRIEETIIREGHANQERVLRREAAVADHVVVRLQPGTTEQQLALAAAAHGGTIQRKLQTENLYLVAIPAADAEDLPNAVAKLSAEQTVRYAEPDYVVQHMSAPNDPSFAQEWALNNTGQTGGTPDADIDAPEAWNVVTGSATVVVAVIDTGVDYNHPDLVANMWTNPGEISGNGLDDDADGYVDDVRGWNFYGDNNNPMDDHFHGTHVAGTIGALGNNGVGVSGVAWQVRIMPLKFLSASGSGFTSDAVEAIHYATVKGARILSCSWGGGGYSQSLKDVIDQAGTAGILMVAAAGNDSNNNDVSPAYPASYKSSNIVAVAATDHNDQLAGFSNYGTNTVHVAAPGVGILSTFPTTMTAAMSSAGLTTSYGRISGTSMATPHVSGVAALALSQTPGLTVAQLRDRLTQRSDRLGNLAGVIQSAGRLNAFNVVNPDWQAGPALLQMNVFSISDIEGNNDGYPNPGEIIRLTPSLLNVGGQAANSVSVELVSQQTTAIVLAPAVVTVGTVNPFVPVASPSPFRIQLDAGLADNSVLSFDLIIHSSGNADVHATVSFVAVAPKPRAEVALTFAPGEMKADPVRNLVYLINKSDRRVMAIDTASGQVAAFAALEGAADVSAPVENGSLCSGQLAVSLDGTRLYVALTAAKEIQVFSLPDLSPLQTLPVNFQPESLACGVNGRLYASSTDYWGTIREVNTTNGLVLQSFDKGGGQQFYMHALLRTSADGTRLYVGETGLMVVGGPGYVYRYDIRGANASLTATHPFSMVYLKDFAVDEVQQRLYTLNGGIYGVQLTDLGSGSYGTVWPFGSAYSAGIAFLPNDAVIYAASGDLYAGNIRKFRRSDGLTLGDYVVAQNADPVPPRGLAITSNGNLLYLKTKWLGSGGIGGYSYALGIIGCSSLNITNPVLPPTNATISFGAVNFGDRDGNGDSVPSPGELIQLAPTFSNTGGMTATNFTLDLTAGSGATLLSSSSQSFGDIAPGASVTATPFRIQLNTGLAIGSTVSFTLTARWNGTLVKTFTYTLTIQATAIVGEQASSLQFGEILADQQRNTVYLLDKRYLRLLAFDTNGGHITKAVSLAGPHIVDGAPPEPGAMAESVDGSLLFVALKKAKMIQVFSLPDLASVAAWSYSFEPFSLACDAAGRLYATTTDASQKLVQIDAGSGQILTQTGAAFSSGLLRRNTAGTEVYGSLGGMIYRYSTTGGGAPSQLGTVSTSGTINDFAIDEANARYYAILGDGKVTLIPLGGGATSTWPLNQTWGSAVALLQNDTQVLGASDYWYGGGIRRFRRSDGSPLQDYVVTSNADGITYRGMVVTPNGRIVYVKRRWDGSSSASTVDGYDYTVGMIGGGVDLDIPGPDPVMFKSLTLSDPAPGNNDGYPNPGETVYLAAALKNQSEFQMSNVVVELLSSDPLAVVQSPTTRSCGNVNSYVTFTNSPVFGVQLDGSLADGHEVKLTLHVTHDGGVVQDIPYSLFIAKMIKAETQVTFAIGEMLADRTRNLAYVIDKTNLRLLAIDTAAGNVAASARLAADPGAGRLALSPDGSRLYVALQTANKVQVFTLPALEQADLFNVGFPPVGLAAGADGKLYASSATTWDYLRQIDPDTGTVLGQFGRRTYYGGSVIKLNGDASALFVAEIGLSGVGQADEYTVGMAGLPVYKEWHPFDLANTKDLAPDDTYRRIYTMSGGVYGIGVTEMDTGVGNLVWPFGAPYGAAIAFLPGDSFIHGGSYYDGIFRFCRADGRRIGKVSLGSGCLMDRAMAITANGRIVYAKNNWRGDGKGIGGYDYYLGIVGASSFVANPPSSAPLINLGADTTTRVSQTAALAASVTAGSGATVSWSIVSGPQGAMVSSASSTNSVANFSMSGAYRVRATVTDGTLHASDIITVNVQDDLPAVSVTATVPTALRGVPLAGAFTFTRTQSPTNSLAVNYTVSGTAAAGVDYTALGGSITIPAGALSATVSVTPLPAAPSFGNGRTVTLTVAANANYNIGVSQQGTVVLQEVMPFDTGSLAIDGAAVNYTGTYLVGSNGPASTLIITNGGVLTSSGSVIGNSAAARSNTVWVTGAGSLWNNAGNLTVGSTGSFNSLWVGTGGQVLASSNVIIGAGAGSSNNAINLTGGNLSVTNANGSGRLDLRNGALALNAGTVTVNQLVATNGGNSVITVSGGNLTAPLVVNGGQFTMTGGTLTVAGAFTNAPGGVFSFSGGSVLVPLQMNNMGAFIQNGGFFDPAVFTNSGSFILNSGTNMDGVFLNLASGVVQQSGGEHDVNVATNYGSWAVSGGVANLTNFNNLNTLILSGGVMNVSALWVTNTGSVVTFNGGTLNSGSTIMSNGSAFVVGDTSGGAILDLLGGSHLFANSLIVGNSSVANALILTNAGILISSSGVIGNSALATNNFALVSGAGSLWSNSPPLYVGSTGSFNQLTINNSGRVVNNAGFIGYDATASNNSVTVTDAGSAWTNSSLYVGYNGSFNNLSVANGGLVLDYNGYIGRMAGANNNAVQVAGSGSVWTNNGGVYVGLNSAGNRLTITNGGVVYNTNAFIGFNSSASNNSVLVSGSGSGWANNSDLYVGVAGSGNQLTVDNSGVVISYVTYLGTGPTSTNNTLFVTDPGTLFWSHAVDVGYTGSFNRLIVSNSAAVWAIGGSVGVAAASSNNLAIVTGAGSIWSNYFLTVGSSGSGNQLCITNGGTVVDFSSGSIGASSSASNNSVLVSGPGSLWNDYGDLFVGTNGPGSQLSVVNGGTVTASNVVVGAAASSSGNIVTVSGGSLFATNISQTGVLDVRRGTLVLNSGTVAMNRLLLTNGANSIVTFNGGTLNSGGSTVNNGSIFQVGDGTSAATLDLFGGTHSFANGLFINTNAILTGTGAIAGSITDAGLIAPGNGFGVISDTGNLTMLGGGAMTMELGGTNAWLYDQFDLTGALTFGGTLTVALLNGYTPQAGDQFNLFDFGSSSGAFSVTNLPTLSPTLYWNTSALYSTGVIEADQIAGSLQVILAPQAAIDAGAKWQVDADGNWHTNNETVGGLVAGSHTLSYTNLTGWIAPTNQTVQIATGVTTTNNGTYQVTPLLLAAVSRKTQGAGTFDLNLNLNGTPSATVEPRVSGPTQLVFTFNKAMAATDGTLDATEFTLTNATFVSASIVSSNLTLNLTNVVDQSKVTVVMNGLTDLAGNPLSGTNAVIVRSLYGDVNQSGSVNAVDLQQVKNNLLTTLTPANFLCDVNCSGSINAVDLQQIKNNLLHSASLADSGAAQTFSSSDAGSSVTTLALSTTTLGEVLGATNLTWSTDGDAPWTATIAEDGSQAAWSGSIGDLNVSWVETTVTGPGTLSFDWMVSSELNGDYLTFAIDGVNQPGAISGEVGWQTLTFNIPVGTHRLTWTYAKNGATAAGLDAGWLRRVVYR